MGWQRDLAGKRDFKIASHVLHRMVNGQMVLLDLAEEQYFGLNEVGTAILNRLIQEPFDEAIAALIAHYDVDPDVLRRDALNLIDALDNANLLERVDGSEKRSTR